MLSKRLKVIADLITTESIVDVGCDHALLDIYLTKEKNITCRACDISEKVLLKANQNIKKYHLEKQIETILSDGLNKLKMKKTDTIVLAGLGTSTILKILNNYKSSNPLVISSNNELEKLRKEIVKKGFYIKDEVPILDKKHWYVVIKFEKGTKKYSNFDYKIGIFTKKNKKYLKYLYNKYFEILNKLPKKYLRKKLEYKILLFKLKKSNKI